MQFTRISIPVTVEEREALRRMAKRELRDPREQARFILRQVLFADLENSKTATSELFQGKQVSGFAEVNP